MQAGRRKPDPCPIQSPEEASRLAESQVAAGYRRVLKPAQQLTLKTQPESGACAPGVGVTRHPACGTGRESAVAGGEPADSMTLL